MVNGIDDPRNHLSYYQPRRRVIGPPGASAPTKRTGPYGVICRRFSMTVHPAGLVTRMMPGTLSSFFTTFFNCSWPATSTSRSMTP